MEARWAGARKQAAVGVPDSLQLCADGKGCEMAMDLSIASINQKSDCNNNKEVVDLSLPKAQISETGLEMAARYIVQKHLISDSYKSKHEQKSVVSVARGLFDAAANMQYSFVILRLHADLTLFLFF